MGSKRYTVHVFLTMLKPFSHGRFSLWKNVHKRQSPEIMSQTTMKPLHTHYDNLKVARNAPPEVIRAAFKTLSQKFHPDRHGGNTRATQAFQMITAAYEVLSDPQRRLQHDEWIARTERKMQREAAVASEILLKRPWNGRERRRKPWPDFPVTGAAATVMATTTAGRLKMPVRALALWIAMALVTVMLLMLTRA